MPAILFGGFRTVVEIERLGMFVCLEGLFHFHHTPCEHTYLSRTLNVPELAM